MMSKLTLFFLASAFFLLCLAHFNAELIKVGETVKSQQQTSNTAQMMTSEKMAEELLQMKAELQHQRKMMETITQLLEEKMQNEASSSIVSGKEGERKRSDGSVEDVMSQTTQKLDLLTADVQALKNAEQDLTNRVDAQDQARGTTYTRWGRASCPSATELVYSGIIGGGYGHNNAAPANYLCLSSTPVINDGNAVPRTADINYVYGSELDSLDPDRQITPACAACRVPRASSIMIPGTNVCATGWHLEYTGHLMAGYGKGSASSEYICVDSKRDLVPGTEGDQGGSSLHYVGVKCQGLPCPPYVDGKLVTCVVCSK